MATLKERMSNLEKQIKELKETQHTIVELMVHLSKDTGGTGWVSTVQNAILNIDNRVDDLTELVKNHKEILETLLSEEISFIPFNNKDLN